MYSFTGERIMQYKAYDTCLLISGDDGNTAILVEQKRRALYDTHYTVCSAQHGEESRLM
jgi:hypothetical protein